MLEECIFSVDLLKQQSAAAHYKNTSLMLGRYKPLILQNYFNRNIWLHIE